MLGKRHLVAPSPFSSAASAFSSSSSSVTSANAPTNFTSFVPSSVIHPVAPLFKPPMRPDEQGREKKCKRDEDDPMYDPKQDPNYRLLCPVLSLDECIVPLHSECPYGGYHVPVQRGECVSCSRCATVLDDHVMEDDVGLTTYDKEVATQRRAQQVGTAKSEIAKEREAELKEAKKYVISKEDKAGQRARDAVDATVKPASRNLSAATTSAIIEETKRLHVGSPRLPWEVKAAAAFIMCSAERKGDQLFLPEAKSLLPGLHKSKIEQAMCLVEKLNPQQRIVKSAVKENFVSRVHVACSQYDEGTKPVVDTDLGKALDSFSMFVEEAATKDAHARELLNDVFDCVDNQVVAGTVINEIFKYLIDVLRRYKDDAAEHIFDASYDGFHLSCAAEVEHLSMMVDWSVLLAGAEERRWLKGILYCLSSQEFVRGCDAYKEAIAVLNCLAGEAV